ncbi:MAG: MarR family transcriptional regulator [Candidatus Cloacimonetes bacterium]|nr:MarR family transcriptional regulator [Candidatus Cloacimonadota bacterium]
MKQDKWQGAQKLGLKPNQMQLLELLQSRGPLSLKGIAHHLGVTPPTVSDTVATLSKRLLINKIQGQDDSRRVEISLSDSGRDLCAQFHTVTDITDMVQCLSAQEQAELLGLVIRIVSRLEDDGKISRSRMCLSCMYFVKDKHMDKQNPHHCNLMSKPLSIGDLRMDCEDHVSK